MADTAPAANNKTIAFRKNPEREPAGVTNTAPMKKPSKAVRKTAKRAMKRGMISEKAAARHLSDI